MPEGAPRVSRVTAKDRGPKLEQAQKGDNIKKVSGREDNVCHPREKGCAAAGDAPTCPRAHAAAAVCSRTPMCCKR